MMYMGFSNIYAYTYIYVYIYTYNTSNTHCMGVLVISLVLGHFSAFITMVFLPLVARRSNPGGRKSVSSKVVELLSWKLWLHAEIEHRRFISLQSIQEEHTHILSNRNHHLDIWSSHLISTHKYDTCRLKSTCDSSCKEEKRHLCQQLWF